jgi:hypothetical protein
VLSPACSAPSWLAGRMPPKIVYLLVRRVLGLAVLVFCTDLAKDAELLVLRHENAVLRRHASRVRYEPAQCGNSARWDMCGAVRKGGRTATRSINQAAPLRGAAGPVGCQKSACHVSCRDGRLQP